MSVKSILFDSFRKLYYFYLCFNHFASHKKILRVIRDNGEANVFFIVSSLPMWRLQTLYDRLKQDPRYHLSIILLPFDTFSVEQQKSSVSELRSFFDSRSITYIDASREVISENRWKSMNPQIIFYQQMYSTIYHGCFSIANNLNKLICYLPYGIITIKGDWIYNNKYTNLAWRLFYPTKLHADYAQTHSFNHGKNIRVVGEPDAALFGKEHDIRVNGNNKQVIWAPHYSIVGGGKLHRASFLWMADMMLKLAAEYKNSITFIIKPHPRLISTLYSLPEWGKQNTDLYFDRWAKGDNTRIETGKYIELFKSSDAMIHDCGSFTAEYLFTGKPVMFISSNIEKVYDELDYFGSKCLDLHYHGSTRKDIVSFLETVVLKDEDPLKKERLLFRDSFLTQKGCNTVGDAIYSSMTADLF